MKSTFLSLLLVASLLAQSTAKTIHVKQDGTGNGTSWKNAFGDLQQALAIATSGDEIWVSEGTYLPVRCDYCNLTQREISFKVPSGVKLYGGFNGTENSLNQRKWFAHPTKLSGQIGSEQLTDNSFTVVYFKNADAGTVLDGFVITGGYSDAWETAGNRNRAGGGIYNDGAGRGGRSSINIRNCVFLENFAEEGGAVFNHGHMGEAVILFDNCTFVANQAVKGGGGIFSNNDLGLGKIELKKCKFVKNAAAFGGAVFITQEGGAGKNQIVSSNFVANKSTAGSVLFTLAVEEIFQPDFFLCDYLNNDSKEGDEVFLCAEVSVPQRLLNKLAVSVSSKI
jgi:predicted outer membrane repeat protein